MWTYTLDTENHVTIYNNRREVWSGSFEAFMADADSGCPDWLSENIHAKYDAINACDDNDE